MSESTSSPVTTLNAMFYVLLVSCFVAALLTGSTLQWIMVNGRLSSQYNILVTVAAIASLVQSNGSYVNYLMAPDFSFPYLCFNVVNWVVMTHTSILLVSKKLSLTFPRTEQTKVWHRLWILNLIMAPISLFMCVAFVANFTLGDNATLNKIMTYMEPIQMVMWGVLEFVLSGAFIVQMWKFQWNDVERQAIYVLVLVGACDILSILTNSLMGNLEATVIKGLVYALRIRLEVAVLGQMVASVRKRRMSISSTDGPGSKAMQMQMDGDVSEQAPTAKGDEGTPGTRVPAGESWGMMALTQIVLDKNSVVLDEDDEEDDNETPICNDTNKPVATTTTTGVKWAADEMA